MITKFEIGNGEFADTRIEEEVSSTNDILKTESAAHAGSDFLLIAYSQSAGKGQKGRSFKSPEGGVYFSLLLHPDLPAEKALHLTTAISVAVSDAIEEMLGIKTGIKWVNDVYANGGKICGILTEGKTGPDGRLEYAIVGVGINVCEPEGGFAEDIKNIAAAMYADGAAPEGAKLDVVRKTVKHFYVYYREILAGDLENSLYMRKYREKSVVLGKRISVIEDIKRPECAREAFAEEIDDECRLLVRFDDGTKKALLSGDVKIMPAE